MSLLVVGTVAFDKIETPFGKTDKIVGGAATYIGLAASYASEKIHLVSVVGDDFPQDFLNTLKNHKVDLAGLEIKKGEKSFFWSGKYHNNMNSRDTLVTELNVLETFNPIVPEGAKQCDFVLLGNLMPVVQQSVLTQMQKRPKLIMLDTMNFWMDIALPELLSVIKNIDILTVNDEEARQLSGEYALIKAAKKILTMGPKYVIIKKGEHGAFLFDKENIFYTPALPLEQVVDPTGAGDSFAGGFMSYLDKTNDLSFGNMKKALVYASAMASFTVEKFGTESLLNLKQSEIDARVNEFKKMTTF